MQHHHRSLNNLYMDATVLTIGSFDGVHQGHQSIFDKIIAYSKVHAVPSVVLTFYPHPLTILQNIQEPYYLTLPDERAAFLLDQGIDDVVTVNFTRELSRFTPFEFMNWVNEHLHIQFLIVGDDFALGKDRAGSPEALKEIGKNLGYETETVPLMDYDQQKISSSRIRNSLKSGNIETANILLGRSYTVPVEISSINKMGMLSEIKFVVELKSDPMQLLPKAGLYTTEMDGNSSMQFTVWIKSNMDENGCTMTGFLPQTAANYSIGEKFTLVFVSRLKTIPASLNCLQINPHIRMEIKSTIDGG